MMLARFFAILVFIAPASGAVAAPLQVQSGEHDGFSRIVATIPLNADWTVTQEGSQVTLKVPKHTDGFAAENVFQFIPRSRIGQVSSVPDGLILDLECDCSVSAFVVREQFVVMDVASPDTVLTTPLIASKQPERGPMTSPRPRSTRTELAEKPTFAFPLIPEQTSRTPRTLAQSSARPMELMGFPEPSTLSTEILNRVQVDLARELGEAASRGTLQPAPGTKLRQPFTGSTPVAEETAPLGIEPPRQALTSAQNIRISDSMDLPENNRRDVDRRSETDQACPDPALFAIEEWVSEDDFPVEIGKAREALFGEFDRLDLQAASHLAKVYLYFGFGAEARQVIDLDPALRLDNGHLDDIGAILEYGSARNPASLTRLIECDSGAALWAALATETIPGEAWVNSDAALLALNKLPVHLRQMIAPIFSRRMLNHGETETASVALRSLQRLPLALQPDATFAQAEVSLQEGETDAGQSQLETVIATDSEPSPEALIALVESKLSNGQPIDIEIASLLEVFAQELRNEPIGPALRQAHVLALAKSGQFDRSFAALDALGGNETTDTAMQLRLELIEELTHSASDIVFLEFAYAQPLKDLSQLGRPAKIAIAERFLSLGFAGTGQEVLATVPEEPLSERRQTLAARLALALGQPLQAQAALVGFDGAETSKLRADAKRMSGQNSDAHALYSQTDDTGAAEETAWLSDDWRDLTSKDTPVLGPVSALPDPNPFDPSERTGMLARTSAALEESASARDVITTLLTAPLLNVPTVE